MLNLRDLQALALEVRDLLREIRDLLKQRAEEKA